MIAPETVAGHELVGLDATVVEADDPGLVGIEGRVVAETTNTLRVETADGVRTVPKAVATFEFALPGGEHAVVEGWRLVARPARRGESGGGSTWQSA